MQLQLQLQLNWDNMDEVVLIGGSSLMPCVMEIIRKVSKLPPDRIKCKKSRYAVVYGAHCLANNDTVM